MNPPRTILVVGASARAAARSLHQAGFHIVAADLFADADLQAIAQTHRIGDLREIGALDPPPAADAWLYTGGVENYPDEIDRLAARLPLWGCSGESLRQIRNVWRLNEVLRDHGFQMPDMSRERPAANDGTWLVKRMKSAGGTGVVPLDSADDFVREVLPADIYYQRHVRGEIFGASFMGTGRHARLIGMAKALDLPAHSHAPPFHYAGSIGPMRFSDEPMRWISALGSLLAGTFQLCGWFGIDLLRSDAGQWYVLEVNPRYPASLEVLERSAGMSLAAAHGKSCRGESSSDAVDFIVKSQQGPLIGKLVLYARNDMTIHSATLHENLQRALGSNDVADLPATDVPVRQGTPLLTIFATGRKESTGCEESSGCDTNDVIRQLKSRAAIVEKCF